MRTRKKTIPTQMMMTPMLIQHQNGKVKHATSTSPSGENKSTNPPADSTGDAKGSTEAEGDEDESSGEDSVDGDDALLTKQKERAMGRPPLGRRRPFTRRNTYKDKGKGTMNSKIQKQAF